MSQKTEIQFDFCKISLVEDQIVHTEFYSYESFDVAEAKILDKARHALTKGAPFYSLVSIMSVFGHMTKEAQEFFANQALCKDLVKHEIILIDSLSIRILAKSYIKWIRPPYQIQLKKNYQDGLEFLRALRDQELH